MQHLRIDLINQINNWESLNPNLEPLSPKEKEGLIQEIKTRKGRLDTEDSLEYGGNDPIDLILEILCDLELE